jgi:(p)ppGpp synthase/HD superfamily hydrolase
MSYEDLMLKAAVLSSTMHHGQVDKGGHPYWSHPVRVAGLCETPDAKMAALLHDLIEDTNLTEAGLRDQGFPDAVVDAVVLLSHVHHEPYLDYVRNLSHNPIAREVKIADLTDNMDESRLGRELTDDDRKRLVKYSKALRVLIDTKPDNQDVSGLS